MSDEFQKKLMNWREADRALVRLAFSLLAENHRRLRYPAPPVALFGNTYPVEDGSHVSGDFVIPDGSSQTWWSCDPGKVKLMGEGGFFANLPANDPYRDYPSAICWYSLQNLIRLRLKDAREELASKLLPQRKAKRSSKQSSRNSRKRRQGRP